MEDIDQYIEYDHRVYYEGTNQDIDDSRRTNSKHAHIEVIYQNGETLGRTSADGSDDMMDFEGFVEEYQDVDDGEEQVIDSYEMLSIDQFHPLAAHTTNTNVGNQILIEGTLEGNGNIVVLEDNGLDIQEIDLTEQLISPTNSSNRQQQRTVSSIVQDEEDDDLSKITNATSNATEYIEETVIGDEGDDYPAIEYTLDENSVMVDCDDDAEDDYATVSGSSVQNPPSIDVSEETMGMDSVEENSVQAPLSVEISAAEDTTQDGTVDVADSEEFLLETIENYPVMEIGSSAVDVDNEPEEVNDAVQEIKQEKKPPSNISSVKVKMDKENKAMFNGPRRYMLFDDLVACIVDLDADGTPMVEFSMPNAETDEKLPVECGICPDVMPRTKLSKHQKCHLVPGTNRYQCIYCDETYKDSKYLAGHARRHMGIRPYVCELCKLYFSTKQDMRVHNQRRHQEKEHICAICGKTFAQNTQLKRHREATHEKMRRFQCEHCPKSYYKNFSLQEHVRAVHMGKRRMIVCPFCGMQCRDAHKMARHRKQMHLNQKHYECLVCNEEFTDINYFDAHKRSIQCRNNTRRKREEEAQTQGQSQTQTQIQQSDNKEPAAATSNSKGQKPQQARQDIKKEPEVSKTEMDEYCKAEDGDSGNQYVMEGTRHSTRLAPKSNKLLMANMANESKAPAQLQNNHPLTTGVTTLSTISADSPAPTPTRSSKRVANRNANSDENNTRQSGQDVRKVLPSRRTKMGQQPPKKQFLLETAVIDDGGELVQIDDADIVSNGMNILLQNDLGSLNAPAAQVMDSKNVISRRSIAGANKHQHQVQHLMQAVMLDNDDVDEEAEQDALLTVKSNPSMSEYQHSYDGATTQQLVEVMPSDLEGGHLIEGDDGELVYEIMIDNNEI